MRGDQSAFLIVLDSKISQALIELNLRSKSAKSLKVSWPPLCHCMYKVFDDLQLEILDFGLEPYNEKSI